MADTSNTPSLSPCPFCGGKAATFSTARGHVIHCDNDECHVYTNVEEDELDDAAAIWNRRFVQSETAATVVPSAVERRFDEIANRARAEADRRIAKSGVTDAMVDMAMEAAGPTTINFRPPFHDDERATVRRMLEAARVVQSAIGALTSQEAAAIAHLCDIGAGELARDQTPLEEAALEKLSVIAATDK